MLQFLIIDDHPIIQAGMTSLLSHQFHAAHCINAYSFEEAEAQLEQYSPDIILLDLSLPGVQGIQAIKQLRKARHNTPILIFTGAEESQMLDRCMEAGASAFLHKEVDGQILCRTITNLMANEQHYRQRHMQASEHRRLQRQCAEQLTNRQREVLHFIRKGFMNKQIAFELGCSENTVKVHIRDIFKILGVNDRSHAVEQALKLGVFD